MKGYSKKIQDMINEITDRMDDDCLDHLVGDDYRYYLTKEVNQKQCLQNFVENYNSCSIGKRKHDDLEASEIREILGDDLTWEFIVLASEVEATNDFYIQWNEMNSFHIGEYEHQIDLEYHPELKAAMVEEGHTDESLLSYGRPCERLILKLDPVEFLKIASKELTARSKRKQLKAVRA